MCGHSKPNTIELVDRKDALTDPDLDKITIKITGENSCEGTDSKGGQVSGSWDVYFEQAIVVELSNGMRYMANIDDGTLGSSSGEKCK